MHRAVINGHTDTIKCLFNAELSGTAINELNNERTADGRSLMDLAPNLATREVLTLSLSISLSLSLSLPLSLSPSLSLTLTRARGRGCGAARR